MRHSEGQVSEVPSFMRRVCPCAVVALITSVFTGGRSSPRTPYAECSCLSGTPSQVQEIGPGSDMTGRR